MVGADLTPASATLPTPWPALPSPVSDRVNTAAR